MNNNYQSPIVELLIRTRIGLILLSVTALVIIGFILSIMWGWLNEGSVVINSSSYPLKVRIVPEGFAATDDSQLITDVTLTEDDRSLRLDPGQYLALLEGVDEEDTVATEMVTFTIESRKDNTINAGGKPIGYPNTVPPQQPEGRTTDLAVGDGVVYFIESDRIDAINAVDVAANTTTVIATDVAPDPTLDTAVAGTRSGEREPLVERICTLENQAYALIDFRVHRILGDQTNYITYESESGDSIYPRVMNPYSGFVCGSDMIMFDNRYEITGNGGVEPATGYLEQSFTGYDSRDNLRLYYEDDDSRIVNHTHGEEPGDPIEKFDKTSDLWLITTSSVQQFEYDGLIYDAKILTNGNILIVAEEKVEVFNPQTEEYLPINTVPIASQITNSSALGSGFLIADKTSIWLHSNDGKSARQVAVADAIVHDTLRANTESGLIGYISERNVFGRPTKLTNYLEIQP